MGDHDGLLTDLPDDVFGLISSRVCHRDLCNLSATCCKLRDVCSSDKLWFPQCQRLVGEEEAEEYIDLSTWRNGMQSQKALFRFINGVRNLVGIWVHQNPELGNLVYVTWGFLSVVGCRIIPQELGPRGMDCGLLWAPVFEIIGLPDGSLAFFLHGRDRDDYCYPGRFEAARNNNCNVLLLEAESFTTEQKQCLPISPDSTLVGLMAENSDVDECSSRRLESRSGACFGRLSFGDRRRLLEALVTQIQIKMPALAQGPVFFKSKQSSKKELKAVTERHALLLWMYIHGDPCRMENEAYHRVVDSEVLSGMLVTQRFAAVTTSSAFLQIDHEKAVSKKNGFTSFVRSKMKQIIGASLTQQDGGGGSKKNRTATSAQSAATTMTKETCRKLQLPEYLQQSLGVGLRLHATSLKLTLYRAWPIICENRFALYKLPEQKPSEGREFAGLWGGTFGWPPGKPAEDKPGKALFFLLLSYDESEEGNSKVLIATKILEGTHYVLHPNGSAMFTARVDQASSARFPWEKNRDGSLVDMVSCFSGEGIANGYGFRYPGAKPGDLFVESSGLLAFVWRESKAVLTLERLNVQEMLRKGEKVGALPPIANFAYLTKANSNVFAGYSGSSSAVAAGGGGRSFGKLV